MNLLTLIPLILLVLGPVFVHADVGSRQPTTHANPKLTILQELYRLNLPWAKEINTSVSGTWLDSYDLDTRLTNIANQLNTRLLNLSSNNIDITPALKNLKTIKINDSIDTVAEKIYLLALTSSQDLPQSSKGDKCLAVQALTKLIPFYDGIQPKYPNNMAAHKIADLLTVHNILLNGMCWTVPARDNYFNNIQSWVTQLVINEQHRTLKQVAYIFDEIACLRSDQSLPKEADADAWLYKQTLFKLIKTKDQLFYFPILARLHPLSISLFHKRIYITTVSSVALPPTSTNPDHELIIVSIAHRPEIHLVSDDEPPTSSDDSPDYNILAVVKAYDLRIEATGLSSNTVSMAAAIIGHYLHYSQAKITLTNFDAPSTNLSTSTSDSLPDWANQYFKATRSFAIHNDSLVFLALGTHIALLGYLIAGLFYHFEHLSAVVACFALLLVIFRVIFLKHKSFPFKLFRILDSLISLATLTLVGIDIYYAITNSSHQSLMLNFLPIYIIFYLTAIFFVFANIFRSLKTDIKKRKHRFIIKTILYFLSLAAAWFVPIGSFFSTTIYTSVALQSTLLAHTTVFLYFALAFEESKYSHYLSNVSYQKKHASLVYSGCAILFITIGILFTASIYIFHPAIPWYATAKSVPIPTP
ncbi:hypothetical protein NEHOM01_1828 [Nematocida homosporus]|uniref:uncharacterized protein n=1 Tax=Nematocida homosporus TaxID=1912981 RepID=UPI00221F2FDD|nr:uncharacterized protein NEHOM01_1828 [Nematocida homosporus]KAI5186970.1 hypothetical protein NEHOM01_1828 [Nematocida homosporus]